MIYYVCTDRFRGLVDHFLERRGRSAARFMTALSYERLLHARTLPRGHYIFADLERLSDEDAELAARAWAALDAAGFGGQLYNHPIRVLRRYELLGRLRSEGINRARVQRVTDAKLPRHYPVFIRRENDHEGSLTPLLFGEDELRKALDELEERGASRQSLIICEFCDTRGEDDSYTKYGAFFVAGRVIPRHVFFQEDWVVRGLGLVDQRRLELERRYLEDNPHEPQLRRIFELCRIDYGRIDYSLRDDGIEVWEINTHPTLPEFPSFGGPAREAVNAGFTARLLAALGEIEEYEVAAGPEIPVDLPRRRWLLRSTRRRIHRRFNRARESLGLRSPRA